MEDRMMWIETLRRRWRLAIHGETVILNALDALQAGHEQVDYIMSTKELDAAHAFLHLAEHDLKRLIDYQDEPEPVYPDEEPMESNAIIGPRARFIDEKEREDYGITRVVPKDYA